MDIQPKKIKAKPEIMLHAIESLKGPLYNEPMPTWLIEENDYLTRIIKGKFKEVPSYYGFSEYN